MKELVLDHVSVRFGKVQALEDVSVQIRAGETVMLVGPNGAGKSTLIRVLLGLVRADAGTFSVDGAKASVDNAFKQHLGYLPEAVAFADNLTGKQVVSFFAAARGVPKARVDQVLGQVGLSEAARRAVRGYSRGMRQRLGLGISILSEPHLLILDEPTGGLDQEGLSVLWAVLAEWREKGRIVLMASHELTLMERRVDLMCVLRDGRVVANDTPAKLREATALSVGVQFTTAPADDSGSSLEAAIRDWGRATHLERDEAQLRVEVEPGDLLGVLDLGTKSGCVKAVRVIEPGLDDVYEKLLEAGV